MMNEDNNNETASLAGGSRRCIHFGSVEVLELPMVIGDNPSAIGVPIGIDWWSDDESDATNDDSYDSNEQLQKEDLERIITSPIKRSRRRLRVHAVPSERRNVASMEDYEKEHPVRRTRRQLHWNRRNREEM